MMSLEAFRPGKSLQVVSVGGDVQTLGGMEKYEVIRAEFRQQVRPRDVIYYYCSEQPEWGMMMGSERYLLVRDGKIVDSIARRMN